MPDQTDTTPDAVEGSRFSGGCGGAGFGAGGLWRGCRVSASVWAEPRSGPLGPVGALGDCGGAGSALKPVAPLVVPAAATPGSDSPEAPWAALAPAAALSGPGGHGPATDAQAPPRGPRTASSRPVDRPATRPLRPADAAPNLTQRECAVLDLVSYGLVNAEIGGELSLSEELVRRVLADVLSKFGVASRAALVGAGFRHGPLRPRAASPGAVGRAAGLSPSLAVLAPLVAEGLTDGQIAARLSSEPGVRVTARAAHSRMQILRTRLGARSREHLVRLAVESGLLVVSPDGARLVLAAAAPGFGGAR